MSSGAWLKWANKNEEPTHKTTCPDCHGQGRWQVGSVDDTPLFQRCFRCKGTGEIGAVLVKGARMTERLVRVKFEMDRDDPMKLARENNREESRMTDSKVELARGGAGAVLRCPSCEGPCDVVRSGTGWTTCPHCDTQLHFGSGEVFAGEVIAASSGFNLTPMERRLARQVGVTFEQAQAAKKLYG
jgi:RecJ-like exonuclease